MDSFFFSGVLDLPWWGCVLAALALTHEWVAVLVDFSQRLRRYA